MTWTSQYNDWQYVCCQYGASRSSTLPTKTHYQRDDSFLEVDSHSHIDLLLLDDDIVSSDLFVLHKHSGIMIDVLEAYHRCVTCEHPDEISDDEDDCDNILDWSPIAIQKLCVSSRRIRSETIQTTFNSPYPLLENDNVQVECHEFGEDPVYSMAVKSHDLWEQFRNTVRSDTVIVAVEATAICHNDIYVQQGMLNEDVPLPFVPGCNFVGIIHYSGPDAQQVYGLKQGDRVASVTKFGGNAKYVSVPADQLIHVPKRVDPSEVAAVLTTYLPAFQALQHGQMKNTRYSPSSLEKKKVLVTDGVSAEGQAAIRMAFWSGASEVYAVGKKENHRILRSLGAIPLLDHPDEWLPEVEGMMDVVLHFEFPVNLDDAKTSMKRKGRLVCFAKPSTEKEPGFSWIHEIQLFVEQSSLSMIKRASLYDPIFSFELYPDQFKRDLKFLLALLVQRQIRPKIDRYIPLAGIPDAHYELQERQVDGAIICEPWK